MHTKRNFHKYTYRFKKRKYIHTFLNSFSSELCGKHSDSY